MQTGRGKPFNTRKRVNDALNTQTEVLNKMIKAFIIFFLAFMATPAGTGALSVSLPVFDESTDNGLMEIVRNEP